MTAFFTFAICIPLGILKAIKHRTPVDNLTSILIFLGYAIPGFALGAVLINILAVQFQIFPLGGFPSEASADLPAIAEIRRLRLALRAAADRLSRRRVRDQTMLMKNSLMENMSADYVRTALAKGLNWRRAVFVHALRNSLIPMATSIGSLLGFS